MSYLVKVLKKYVPPIVRAYFRRNERFFKAIENMPIVDSGVDADGVAFVQLENGKKFFNFPSNSVQRCVYKYFSSKKTREKVAIEAFNVAYDIEARYNLPTTEKEAQLRGKYYDFKEGDIIVESGSYVGFYALKAAEIVGENGRVIAIEAIPDNYKILKKNIEENGLKNVTYMNRGVWSGPHELKIFRMAKQTASFRKVHAATDTHYNVPADSLDNLLAPLNLPRVDFLRLQLNGAEVEALDGIENIQKHNPKMLLAGLYKRDGDLCCNILDRKLRKMGYQTEFRWRHVFAWR